LDLAEPRDAQFVMASLVSSGTTRGEPPFVPKSASIASELAGQVTAIAALAPNRLRPGVSEPREGPMTFQISQRGKEYLRTAQTLLRAAQTMTDRVIAGQLKALADDYQRRAEKASHVDAAKAFARSAADAEDEWRTGPDTSSTAQPPE
jgi:hypothetical protein